MLGRGCYSRWSISSLYSFLMDVSKAPMATLLTRSFIELSLEHTYEEAWMSEASWSNPPPDTPCRRITG